MSEKDVYELTNPQKSIWLTEEYYKGTNVNNVCGIANIEEKLNFDVLQEAINTVIKNNSSFLINFKLEDGKLVQYKTDYKYFNIEIVELASNAEIETLANKLQSKIFEIENNYLFEFKIFKFKNNFGGFMLNIHHLLSDSWTLGLTCKKIVDTYNSLITGEEKEISSSDYFDFCESEKEYLNSDKYKKDKEYWENLFETIPEIASMPSNKKVSSTISCKANRKTYEFSSEVVEKINTFCKNNKISIFNFITAVYSLYFSRVCNLDDFVIGTPILNRTDFIQKNTTGMFVSTVPLRINVNHESSFADLATSIGKNSMGMLRHQRYPYEYLLKKLREKEPNLPNLYNVLISYQITKAITNGLKYSTTWAFNGNCADELQIHILDINDTGKLNISYDYKIDKFDEQDINDFHKRIEHVVSQVLKNNKILLSNIEITTKKEKHELINISKNIHDFHISKSIIELVEDISNQNPNKIAIEDINSSITYKELINKVNQTSNYLLENYNISEKNNIGVFTYRNIETVIFILAILKINCTYVPIDPEYPIDRIEYMIENSGIKYILTLHNVDILKNIKTNYIAVNNDIIKNYSSSFNKKYNYNPEDNLYIIFTSGSTGKPKGIALKQRNMLNLIFHELEVSKMFKKIKNIRILQFATMSFDVSYQEIFTSLLGSRYFNNDR